jgi:hypothetical protein
MAEITVHHEGPLISREEARIRGEKDYFTGEPCRSGHIAQRRVSNRSCRVCIWLNGRKRREKPGVAEREREAAARWRQANPERAREANRRWREAHPERAREVFRAYRQRNVEELRAKARAYQADRRAEAPLRKTLLQRKRAGRAKPAVCDLCHRKSGKICFDHCHATGRFRGWLCDTCNSALGFANDDPKLLRRMARYLEKSRQPDLLNGANRDALPIRTVQDARPAGWPEDPLSGALAR